MRRRKTLHPNEIDHELATLWLNEGHNCYFVDLRDPQSYQFSCIVGAQQVQQNNFAEFVTHTASNADIILYCYLGSVSRYAMQHFTAQGFKHVYSLIGGFEAWRRRCPQYVHRPL